MRTKIIATLGPSSFDEETLSRLITAGVRIFRLNFSHSTAEQFSPLIARLRALEEKFGVSLTLLQDLAGPKIRIGELAEPSYSVSKGGHVLLGLPSPQNDALLASLVADGADAVPFVPFDHESILHELVKGDRLVLSDGSLQFAVSKKISDTLFELEAANNGIITSRKGLALPGKDLHLAALTEKDKKDLSEGLAVGIDAVALSFVQGPEDILEAKALIQSAGRNVPVIAKLERRGAVNRLEEILDVADVVMVARGDLGVECPLPELPAMQKRIIRACNRRAKPVIVATQMLLSMVNSPSPTRAETTDVANAVLDGADCVMLSEETAMGNFPVETVEFMQRIADAAEELVFERAALSAPRQERTPDFLAYAACLLAEKAGAVALVAHSVSGSSARMIAACRPRQTVYALTPDPEALRFLNFSWGVEPRPADINLPGHLLRSEYFVNSCKEFVVGDDVVITAGQFKNGETPRGTNLVKIYRK